MAVKDALYALKDHSEVEALREYMKTRGEWLGIDIQDHPILVRLGCMLRLYTPQEGKQLLKAWGKLSVPQKQPLDQEFDPFTEYSGVTPTYIPAVLLNVWNSKYGTPEERLDIIMTTVLPKLVQHLTAYRAKGLTLNFNQVAGYCRDHIAELKTSPGHLTHDDMGRVSVIESQ